MISKRLPYAFIGKSFSNLITQLISDRLFSFSESKSDSTCINVSESTAIIGFSDTKDSNAMIISKGSNNSDVEYGAIYEDRKSISEIRTSFEKTWDIAANLDENLVANYIQ